MSEDGIKLFSLDGEGEPQPPEMSILDFNNTTPKSIDEVLTARAVEAGEASALPERQETLEKQTKTKPKRG